MRRSTVTNAGPAVTLLSRKIRSAPERFCVAIEEHRQRPATLLAETMQCAHVDGVDIGTLLAIDFDIDEELVHHLRRAGIFEALVRHHMAPVTGGVSDRKQDRLVCPLRFGEGFRTPCPPMDGIVLMLQQIRTRLVLQTVFAHRDFSRFRSFGCGGGHLRVREPYG